LAKSAEGLQERENANQPGAAENMRLEIFLYKNQKKSEKPETKSRKGVGIRRGGDTSRRKKSRTGLARQATRFTTNGSL